MVHHYFATMDDESFYVFFDYGFQCTTPEEFIALYRHFLVDGMRKKLNMNTPRSRLH